MYIFMENKKLTWEEIRTLYNKEWVELVDYDWPEEETYPVSGTIRSHGSQKKEFHQQCRREPVPNDSAILFVGPPHTPDDVVFSPSLIRVEPCVK